MCPKTLAVARSPSIYSGSIWYLPNTWRAKCPFKEAFSRDKAGGSWGSVLFTFIKYQSLIPLYLKLTEKSLACFSLMAGRKERESIDYSEVDNKYYSGFNS